MLPAPFPPDEGARIASLRRMQLLSTPDEEAFDRVTRTAQRLFKVPIALLSLVDAERQWFKSCIGLPVRETPREVSFCGHAILGEELFVVEDATLDPRFADNPLVVGEPRVVFYAGCPLRNSEGHMVGTLCIIDHQPRVLSPELRQSLEDLGRWLEMVFLNRELGTVEKELLQELDEFKRNSLLDPTLNLWRDTAICNIVSREVERSFQGRRPLGLVKVRLETQGHEGAREVPCLIELAKRFRPLLRSYDSVGYLGGAEFIAVLPDTAADRVQRVAERLSSTVNLYPMVLGEEVHELTASIGVVCVNYAEETPDAQTLMERVSEALDQAAGGDSKQRLVFA